MTDRLPGEGYRTSGRPSEHALPQGEMAVLILLEDLLAKDLVTDGESGRGQRSRGGVRISYCNGRTGQRVHCWGEGAGREMESRGSVTHTMTREPE